MGNMSENEFKISNVREEGFGIANFKIDKFVWFHTQFESG
jgi:hypothetical protein